MISISPPKKLEALLTSGSRNATELERNAIRSAWKQAIATAITEAVIDVLTNDNRRSNNTSEQDEVLAIISSFLQESKLFDEVREICELIIGTWRYPLLNELKAGFVANLQVLVVDRLQRVNIQGKGSTFEEALNDLTVRFHTEFQRLYRMLSDEMTPEDRERWEIIQEVVDVPGYEASTPIQFRQIAEVTSRTPFRIKWWGDKESLDWDIANSPALLASFDVGTKFEAIVEFDPKSQSITKILAVEYLPPNPRPPSEFSGTAGLEGLSKVSINDI